MEMKALVSFCSLSSATLKTLKKGSGKLFHSLDVPQGLVLGPSQTSYRPGAMFFPQGVVEQTDSQAAHSRVQAQPANTRLPRLVLVGKESRKLIGLCALYI